MNLTIKILGEGTKEEITTALQHVINSLVDHDETTKATWEDQTLYTQINY
ncbi:MAG TPA: hypothetical protein VGM30_10460 [Puia sp.]|jgi:hypothetical protein